MDYDIFRVLNLLQENNHYTQRNISEILNISLGKTNMLLKELIEQSHMHLVINMGKSRYYLTESGIELKNQLNHSFLSDCFNVILEFKNLVKENVHKVLIENVDNLIVFLGNNTETTKLLKMAALEIKQEIKIRYKFVSTLEELVNVYEKDGCKVFIWEKDFENELKSYEIEYLQLLSSYYPKRSMDLNFNGILH